MPMPASAPGERFALEGAVAVVAVAVAGTVDEAEVVVLELVVVVVLEVVELDDELVVEVKPVSVDTTPPIPFRTMPRPSAQHVGSLSQQKLPSVQLSTLGRKPVPGSG